MSTITLVSKAITGTADFFNGEPAATSLLGEIEPGISFTASRNDDNTFTFRLYERREGHAGLACVSEKLYHLS